VTGYDYGSARLRARRRGLLRHEQYAGLLGRDGPGLLAGLAASSCLPQAGPRWREPTRPAGPGGRLRVHLRPGGERGM